MIRKLRHFVVYSIARCTLAFIQSLSLDCCERMSDQVAWLFTYVIPIRKQITETNLKRTFPEMSQRDLDQLRFRMWRHLSLMICEIAHAMRKLRRSNWHDYVRIVDRRHLVSVILDDRTNILVSGHFGNFEISGRVLGIFGIPVTSIARPLDNPYAERYLSTIRSEHGQTFLPKDGSAAEIQAFLSTGGTLALLADQHAGAKGCWVSFLGRPAACHKALALFTLSSGAPMTVAYTRRLHRMMQFEIGVTGIADPKFPASQLANVQSLTQWYNDCLEVFVRKDPEQYWWLHNRWREPPPRLLRQAQKAA